jgi:hypothetical protein
MTLSEFNTWDEIKQAEALLNDGVMVAERAYKQFNILLYQVKDFYVEVYYNTTFSIIQGFRGFDSMTSLDPYLQEIDITSLHY